MWKLRKTKITCQQFVNELCFLIHKISNDNDKQFESIISNNYLDDTLPNQKEIIRRKWELLFFLISAIVVSCSKNLSKYNYESFFNCFCRKLIDIYGNEFKDNKVFIELLLERNNIYSGSLLLKNQNPAIYIARCFCSAIWLNPHIDVEGKWLIAIPMEIELGFIEIYVTLMKEIDNVFKNSIILF